MLEEMGTVVSKKRGRGCTNEEVHNRTPLLPKSHLQKQPLSTTYHPRHPLLRMAAMYAATTAKKNSGFLCDACVIRTHAPEGTG